MHLFVATNLLDANLQLHNFSEGYYRECIFKEAKCLTNCGIDTIRNRSLIRLCRGVGVIGEDLTE